MRTEYPNYYEAFHCIAGDCTETCCAGWEVDLDEDALYYYQEIAPSPFGDVIRSHIQETEEGDYVFPLRENGRCPFLRDDNLCDIITHLGESRICRTCTEHPRFVVEVADYRQYDLSLSCPEAARLFFQEDAFQVVTKDTESPIYMDSSYKEDPDFMTCLACRDKGLALLKDQTKPLWQRLESLASFLLEGNPVSQEPLEQLLDRLKQEDKWDARWAEEVKNMKEALPHMTDEMKARFYEENRETTQRYFEKLAMYLVFRYFPDAYYDGNPIYGLNMVMRSMVLLELLAFSYWWRGSKGATCSLSLIHI